MSMLGMAYLSEIITQCKDHNVGEILDNLRKRVIVSLHQSGKIGESKDGMDIAMCFIDFDEMKLHFAGAYNPIYLIRELINDDGSSSNEFIEIRGDRMPIGYSIRMDTVFTNHEISLKKDDMIYLLTDGFQDQLSGKTMQKFKRNNLRELFTGIYKLPLAEQKSLLEVSFDGYRDDYPQIDDVLIFGLRI